jgi:hypothetical protein
MQASAMHKLLSPISGQQLVPGYGLLISPAEGLYSSKTLPSLHHKLMYALQGQGCKHCPAACYTLIAAIDQSFCC